MKGLWKLRHTLRGGVKLQPPRRLRFIGDEMATSGRLELPFLEERCSGEWRIGEAGSAADGLQQVWFRIECRREAGAAGSSLAYEGVSDGERVAGTVCCGEDEVIGDFLCTRLFQGWGEPKPAAEG